MILITGVSGFIGKHLLSALIEKYGSSNVVALTSRPVEHCNYLLHHNYKFDKNYFIQSGYSSIDTIIHAGAFTPKSGSQANEWENCTSNIINTVSLISAELPALKKFVFLSTLDVYGPQEIITEESPVQPVSLYGSSKRYCEQVLTEWAKENNKIFQLLRVGHVYGPGEELYQKIIPITMQKLLKDQPLQIWGTGTELRSFIYINDITNAILKSLLLEEDAGVINLVSEHKITMSALVDKLVSISNCQNVTVEVIPTQQKGRDLIFDNTKMKRYLLSSETPLDEGLKEEWNYMRRLTSA